MSRSRKIRVCHLTCVHSAQDVRIFAKQCRSLRNADYDVVIYGLADADGRVDGVEIRSVPAARRFFGRVTVDMLTSISYRILRGAMREQADIYHFHDPHLIPVGLLLKALGKKVIYDVHEFEPGRFSASIRGKRARKLVARGIDLAQVAAGNVFDGVVGATPFIFQQFQSRGVCSVAVNNYPLLEELGGSDDSSPSTDAKPMVAYVGLISRIRGILQVVRALEYTKAGLILCGQFSDAALHEECQSLPGWERVQYLGHVDRESIPRILKSATAGLVTFLPHPNHFEAQPNKLFEYMAAGLPVIVSDFKDWRSLVEGRCCGLCVDPESPEAIGKAIDRLVAEPSMAYHMGQRAKKLVLSEWNWGIEERKLLSFYKKVLNEYSS